MRLSLLLAAACFGAALLIGASSAHAAITITKVRDLFFGYCDNTPSLLIIVAASDTPGASACTLATSARFQVTGGVPNAVATITLPSPIVLTVNGVNRNVTLNRVPTGSPRFSATGTLTIWVGGRVRIPAGGYPVGTNGLWTSLTGSITVN